jgi:SAM-dependent methyltransferase
MGDLKQRQLIQESQYFFPYHYIPILGKRGFRQVISLKWGYEYLSYLYFTIERVTELDFRSLLDVGCGDGRLLFELNQIVTGKRLVGIDYSKRSIELAKLMSPGLEWISEDITGRALFEEKFDVYTKNI